MKLSRLVFLLALLLTLGSAVRAQLVLSTSPAGAVVAPVDQNGWHNFKVPISQNITSFTINGTPTPSQAQITVIFTENSSGGFSVTFGAGITNGCTVTTTANATTVCQFNYDGTTSTWLGISGTSTSSSSNLSPVLINNSIDVFNRTGTGLGANWTPWLNSLNTTLGPPGFAVGTTANYNLAAYTATASNSPSQRVRVSLLNSGATGTAGAALRINGTPTTSVSFYMCVEAPTTFAIFKVITAANGTTGTTTNLANQSITGAPGDFLDFSVVGNDLICSRNGGIGSSIIEVDDSSITTGVPGIFIQNTTYEIGQASVINTTLPGGATENIVFDGDSIIASNGQGSPTTDPATSFLQLPTATAYVANLGVASKCLGVGCPAINVGTLQSMVATGTSVIDPLFAVGLKNIVVLFTANNDLAVGGQTPAQVITSMTTYVANRHAAGWKVLVVPSISRTATTNAALDQQEVTLAQLILANPMGADAVIKLPINLTSAGTSANPNLYNSDQVHPTELTHIDIFARVFSAALAQF